MAFAVLAMSLILHMVLANAHGVTNASSVEALLAEVSGKLGDPYNLQSQGCESDCGEVVWR